MAKYLLIESRDPFESAEVEHYYQMAVDLAAKGNEVTLFLVQNGVLPARASSKARKLGAVSRAGVKVLADDFSLKERGIPRKRVRKGVRAAKLDVVLDQLADGCKAMWH